MKCRTCKIVVSKGNFTITNLLVTVSPEIEFQIDKIVRTSRAVGELRHSVGVVGQ